MGETSLDPRLAGNAREQYLQELSAGRELCLSPQEKAVNRQMALALTSLGVLGGGLMLGLSWIVPLIIGTGLYLSLPIYQIAYETSVKKNDAWVRHTYWHYISPVCG